jgi:nucleotide-binding universal stress UspA family protein
MKTLLCVAGMPFAETAVQIGGQIAGFVQSQVTLLHVIRREQDRANGERILAAATDMLPKVALETRVRRGNPVKEILTEIREGDYDLVVVGARQQISAAQRLLGSVTQQIIRRAPVSVLVARRTRPTLERVLICTGGADVAEPVIEFGGTLAELAHAQTTLLHVVSPVPSMYTGLCELEETLAELLQTDTPTAQHLRYAASVLEKRGVTGELRLRCGVAADEILREALEGGYDLVVIGASGTAGRIREWLLGNVTRQIAENAPCSTLVVKQESSPRRL